MRAFDEHAEKYDGWFMKNPVVLQSEVLLIRAALGAPGRTLSVGCGSGLFESILRREHGIAIDDGVEPSEGMAAIARARGMRVHPGRAEELPATEGGWDTVLMNGTPGYVDDLAKAFAEAARVLRPGGHVVVADVPKESSYALLYMLATERRHWGDRLLVGVAPACPYPIEFAAAARWRTTPEKARLLEAAGFVELEYLQTLTRHPVYSNDAVEEPVAGFDRGDYVAIRARRP